MKKMNRRSFLHQAGAVTAALATGAYARAAERTERLWDSDPLAGALSTLEDHFVAKPEDHGKALINPGMGWTMHFYSNILTNYGSQLEPSDTLEDFPGQSTVYLRVPWAFLEPEEGQFVWELLDTPAQRWIDSGRQVAFRVSATESWMYYATPKWVFDAGAKGYDVEGHIFEPEYDDPIFLEKLNHFLAAMAARFDHNPHVAFVDVGHFGMWGEGHTVMTTPKHGHAWGFETQKHHIDLYCNHFKATQLCISDDFVGHDAPGDRFPISDYALSRGVTLRDDSILVQPVPRSWYHSALAQHFWPTMPVILEHEHYGGAVERGSWDQELLVRSVEEYHASFMSIHWWPRILLEKNRDAIDRINRRLGYRMQLHRVEWPQQVKMGEPFEIRTEWSNSGVAPCYAGGFPCFTLKDEKGGIVSALVDESLDVKSLQPASSGEAVRRGLTSTFRIAPRYGDKAGTFFRACKAGTYTLYVSVGMRDGTPRYALPYEGEDGKRRYRLGSITIQEA
ncbi:MAG: DUF4832 domain-containing protein [Alistipes sp.]|nr:DUF4832 domain-containing protein [Alistipes sp.]